MPTAAELELQKVVKATHSAEDLLAGDHNILDQFMVMFEEGFFKPIIYWQLLSVIVPIFIGWLVFYWLRKKTLNAYAQKLAMEHLEKSQRIEGITDEEGAAEKAKTKEELFWLGIKRGLFSLFMSICWPLVSLFLIFICTVTARLFKLLPQQPLPIESVVWLILCAFVVIRVCVFIIHHSFRAGRAASSLESFISFSLWIGVALQVVGVLPKCREWLESTKFSLGSSDVSLWSMLLSFFTIALALFIAKWLGQLAEKWLNSMNGLHTNLKVVLIRILKVALMFIAILIGLSSVGIDVTVLGVFGGAVGVGLGFGLQKITSNYISGFIILLDRSVKIGDLVTVSGVEGIVADIKTRYTVVRAFDGSVTIIPNESFVTGNVKNTSYLSGPGRTTVAISVDYSSNIDDCINTMNDIVRSQPRVLINPAPYTILTNFGNDGIDLTSYFWVADPERGTAVLRSNISRAILKKFNEKGVNIPFPQRDLRILQMPEISCKFETGTPAKAAPEPKES